MKACNICGEAKPATEFPVQKASNGKTYAHSNCRACRREQCRAWAKTERGREVKRAGVLRRNFGLDEAAYLGMFAKQGGLCAICAQPETKLQRGRPMRLSVDHDHTTGDVRSLLCQACNVGLGSFSDNPERLRLAAAYLESHREHVA